MKHELGVGLLIAGLLFLVGCSKPKEKAESNPEESSVQYATRFDYNQNELIIKEPWPGVVVTSTTHLPYLELLGVTDALVGFPNTSYIYSPVIRERVASGLVTDLGPDGSMNLELLLSINPDLVIAFDMGQESASIDKVRESGIQVIYNADYLETSILGRAEWIKAFGKIFGREAEADSIFTAIVTHYDQLKAKTQDLTIRPSIFSGIMYGATWFLPGGNNWSARLFQDAGGDYLWRDDTSNGWLEISFESVYDKAGQADFWIGTATVNSLDQLQGQDERYASFNSFKEKTVFNYGKRISPGGGYDYFESGYARPDLVLADLIAILHPDLMPDHQLYYFEQLQ